VSPGEDLVADAKRVIGTATAASPEERFEALAWQALLDVTGPRLLSRDCAPAHVTASGLVLSPDARQTCLVLHGKLRRWVQPGGHLEAGDASLSAAAAREVLEETGLSTRPAGVPVMLSRHGAPCAPGVVDWHLDVQYVLVSDVVTPQVSDESHEVAWWPVDALPEPAAWGVKELVERSVTLVTAASPAGSP
jgi:8-oxo-dGTP pyrophosphatase MutT (NUDIX family)